MIWLFLIVLIDGIGFGIILPLLPLFVLKFNLTPFHIGILAAVFSFAQFITAPILGMLSDKFGRKKIIVTCLFIISASYYLLSIASTFLIAVLARFLAGSFSGNISVVLASASDLSNSRNRTKYMGIIGAGYGIGFVLGPIIGGFLAGDSNTGANFHLVFYVAALFTLIAGVIAGVFSRETIKVKNNPINIVVNIRRTLTLIVNNKNLMFLIYLSILMWFAFASINVFLTTWAVLKFNLNPMQLGTIATIFASIAAIMQILSPKLISGGKAILLGFQISAFAIFAIIFEPNMNYLLILLVFLAMGIGILFPNLNATISVQGSARNKGFILGLSQSSGMLGQTLGPLIVGFLYSVYSPTYAWLAITASFFLASFITLFFMLNEK